MTDTAFLRQLEGFALTTAEIIYRLPDHQMLLQSYIWQDYDLAPRFPKLIEFLNSDDPVVRLASIRTLEVLTGQTLGYDYAAPEWRRQDMIRAWVEWYNLREPSPSLPDPTGQNSRSGRAARPRPGNADTVS